MNEIADKIPRWLISGVVGVIVFAAGFVTNYYVDYRSQYIQALNANYEQFDKASEEIRDTLRVFADIARGEKSKSQEDLAALQTKLLVAVGKVEDLSRRVGDGAEFVQVFQDAAVNLRNAAEEIDGPRNGKSMVLAVNDYLVAESRVRDAVLQEYNSFLW